MILTRKQEEGLKIAIDRYKHGEKYTIIAGQAGSGKAQPVDTIIPTPKGYKKMGDIKAGDYVYDRYGKPTKVLNVFLQGKLDCYEVVFEDGRKSLCNDEHLWSYFDSHGRIQTKTLRQMLDVGLKYANRGGYRYKVLTLLNPIEYKTKDFKIDPYVMGCFLGDGCCKESILTISSADEELVAEVARLIGANYKKNSKYNYNWNFKLKEEEYHKNEKGNSLITNYQTKEFFKDYLKEVCVYAHEKSIPEEYKYGSVQQRLDLIQGLLDTDGSIVKNDGHRYNIRFTSISIKLIKDLQEILWSLGIKSSILEDKRKEKYPETGVAYNLSINMPNEEKFKLFRLSKKKKIAEEAKGYPKHRKYDRISIVEINKCDYQKEMVCFYVENPEHLYLTNNYLVTHNTELVKYIISSLASHGIEPENDVVFCSYTGKATQVLQSKGNHNVSTLHKLLYESRPKPDGTFFRIPVESIPYKIVVVDEISLVPLEMIKRLFSHDIYMIGLGDNAQLPCIYKNEDNHLLDRPHVFLDEVMRQAQESEIIRLSMAIREGKPIEPFSGKEVMVLNKKELNTGMLQWADQILTATNATRIQINNQMRELLGRGEKPEEGDKVICLRNYWETFANNGDVLVNGTIGYLKNVGFTYHQLPYNYGGDKIDVTVARFETDNGTYFKELDMDTKMILTGEKCITDPKKVYKISKVRKFKYVIPKEFTYGYAISCHKSQGSQFDRILVLEENFPFNREEHRRWAYTAVTRAVSKVVFILNN